MMKLELALPAFEGLYESIERTRRTSATTKVDRNALATLLRDHQKALKRLGELGERPTSPGE